MTRREALKLIAGGENLTVELKEQLSSNQARAICKEVAALATMQGGHLFIGVKDDATVCGVADATGIIQRIESWIVNYVAPAPIIECETLKLNRASVVYVRVGEGVAPIYYYDGRPYLRVGTQSARASPAQVEYLVNMGKVLSEMRANTARMASIEQTLHPGRHTAAAIFGQGELATMNYENLRDRIFNDLGELLPSVRRRLHR